VWVVDMCRADINSAFNTVIACVAMYDIIPNKNSLYSSNIINCLRLLGKHLGLIKQTEEAGRTIDTAVLMR
jgi:hypothetical protein